jgi:hypothetical protein
VPELVVVDVEARIREPVEQRRPQLIELVDRELEIIFAERPTP